MLNRGLIELGFFRPFSRKMESEADYIGLLIMSKACFDPRKSVGVWERMKETEEAKGGNVEFMSTHPSHGI